MEALFWLFISQFYRVFQLVNGYYGKLLPVGQYKQVGSIACMLRSSCQGAVRECAMHGRGSQLERIFP